MSITNNAKLSTCQPTALKAALAASSNWSKAYTENTNLACAAGKSCVGAIL